MTRVITRMTLAVAALLMAGCDPTAPFRAINDDRAVDRVTVDPGIVSATVGDTLTVTAQPLGPGNRVISEAEITWSSGNQFVTRSIGGGRFVALAPGETQLLATSRGRRGIAFLTVIARR